MKAYEFSFCPKYVFKQVLCYGQPIGAIVAESREIARSAIWLVKVEYEDLKPILTVEVSRAYIQCTKLNVLILLIIKILECFN